MKTISPARFLTRACIKWVLLLLALMPATSTTAQTPEMADGMRADGKIYVVVVIVLVILAGLIGYLFSLDRKVKKLEALLKEKSAAK
ncbi:MAG TPA: hypothetical protein VEB86_19150 [Chryseosolibacter sp.]|nr:hypothetical protein [Chryseosolibacter sp.]